jgi:hypothetical protein
MKDWVIEDLKREHEAYAEDKDFDSLNLKDRKFGDGYEGVYGDISHLLLKGLRCSFKRDKKKCDRESDQTKRFIFAFCSVLSNLEKSEYRQLLNIKDAFFVYLPPKPACVKGFKLKQSLNEEVKIVIFYREIAQLDWPVIRWIIAHEIAHLLVGLDDNKADSKVLDWGFEKGEFDKWCKEKRVPELLWEFAENKKGADLATKKDILERLREAATAIALCPNIETRHGETCDLAYDEIVRLRKLLEAKGG